VLKTPPALRILGIDPGTATVGYGVLDCLGSESFSCPATGIIQTKPNVPMGDRLKIIRTDLISLIEEYDPDVLALEAIFFFKNAKTLVPVAQARGVILEAASTMGVPTFEYTPMQVKLNLTGFGRADKRLVQLTVQQVLCHQSIIKPDDAADAIALAICHARMSLSITPPERRHQNAPSLVLHDRSETLADE
jgi:crossover junction endodeoxyribonuclease RuvC